MLNICSTAAAQRIYESRKDALCISLQREFALVNGNAFRGGGKEMDSDSSCTYMLVHLPCPEIRCLFVHVLHSQQSLVCIAAALSPCSVAVHSHGPIRPFSWTLLSLKTIKEAEYFLNWNEQMTRSAHHLTGMKGQLTKSIRSRLELLGQWRIQAPSCLPLPSRGCKSAMECQDEVQRTLFLWFLHSQWSKFGLKREYRMLFCALIFMNTQSFFCCLLQAHTFCHSTFRVCSLPHYSILPYRWTQLGATVLHIEITELGQNFILCCCGWGNPLLKNLSHQVHFICPETF